MLHSESAVDARGGGRLSANANERAARSGRPSLFWSWPMLSADRRSRSISYWCVASCTAGALCSRTDATSDPSGASAAGLAATLRNGEPTASVGPSNSIACLESSRLADTLFGATRTLLTGER
eukprot:2078487-Prymnesium_polylepis.1